MHYSRVMPLVDGQRYHTSTSVLMNEVIKLGISLSVVGHCHLMKVIELN